MLSKINNQYMKNPTSFTAQKQQHFSDNSQKPSVPMRIAIVDSFTKKTKDINGDGCPDLAHGEVVEAIARGNLKYSPEIVRFDDKSDGGEPLENDLLDCFKAIEADKSIKAVNVSIASTTSFSDVNDFCSDKLKKSKKGVNADNISANKKELVALLGEGKTNPLKKVITSLENIAKNAAVFIAGGNSAAKEFNLYNFAEGTIGVGCMETNDALKLHHSYTKKSAFSGDNSLLRVFSKGEYDIVPMYKDNNVVGYDITEDGVLDIPVTKITGYPAINRFVGKDIDELAAVDDDYKKVKELQLAKNWGVETNITDGDMKSLMKKLYSLDKLLDYDIVDVDTVSRSITKGHFATLGSALNMKESLRKQDAEENLAYPIILFKVSDGKVVYNPHISIRGDISVGTLKGTSYSTPTAMAEHVNSLIGSAIEKK